MNNKHLDDDDRAGGAVLGLGSSRVYSCLIVQSYSMLHVRSENPQDPKPTQSGGQNRNRLGRISLEASQFGLQQNLSHFEMAAASLTKINKHKQ